MVFGLIIAAIVGLIPAAIANNKGRSFFAWWLYGFLLWIVALPHSILLKPNEIAAQSASDVPAGDAQRKAHGWRTALIFAGLIVGGIIIVVLSVGPSGDSSTSAASSSDMPASDGGPQKPAALEVSAEKLYSVYQNNEVAADQIYKGKLLAVSGVVRSINKDILDDPYLELAASDEFDGVQAHLKVSEESKAATLSKGDSIIVLCTGSGMIMDSPMLTGCVIQPNSSQAGSTQAASPPLSNASVLATSMPRELWGVWTVTRALPGEGFTPCNEGFQNAMLGTQIEYSPDLFRWKDTTVKQPRVKEELVSTQALSNEYRTDIAQLGFSSSTVTLVTIAHPDANLTGATIEIPGDTVLLKAPGTIVFTVCGDWFEAQLTTPPSQN